jgi:hypothetical protein
MVNSKKEGVMKKVILAVLAVAFCVMAQVGEVDTLAATPVKAGYIRHDTIPARADPVDKGWMILNLKRGDALALTARRAKQNAAYANAGTKFYGIDDMCRGSDAKNYKCIQRHTAQNARKPITGVSWASYWVLNTSAILDTVIYKIQDTTDVNDFDIKINIDYMAKKHNYDSIP